MSFPICMCLSGACTSVALKGKQVRAKSCDRSICTVSVSSLERIQWHIEFLVGVPYVQMGLWDHKTPEIQSFTPHDCFLDVWFPKSVYSLFTPSLSSVACRWLHPQQLSTEWGNKVDLCATAYGRCKTLHDLTEMLQRRARTSTARVVIRANLYEVCGLKNAIHPL